MTSKIEQQLIDNISQILKRSLVADATLADLRAKGKAGFKAIFTKEAGFTSDANTFQPYVEEIADDLLAWQKSHDEKQLVGLVKKIEQLYTVLAKLEKSYSE
jgi:hypothetical protein